MIRLLPVLLLTGCVTDSINYDATNHVLIAHRYALFTNIGTLSAHLVKNADGSITVSVDEGQIDQTTAAAQALTAAAQLALKATPP